MNKKEIQVMIMDRNNMSIKEIGVFEVVDQFVFLGSLITNKGVCDEKIQGRLAIGRNPTIKLTRI